MENNGIPMTGPLPTAPAPTYVDHHYLHHTPDPYEPPVTSIPPIRSSSPAATNPFTDPQNQSQETTQDREPLLQDSNPYSKPQILPPSYSERSQYNKAGYQYNVSVDAMYRRRRTIWIAVIVFFLLIIGIGVGVGLARRAAWEKANSGDCTKFFDGNDGVWKCP